MLYLQGLKELEGLEQKAKASGASQLVVKDLTEEFVKDYIFPCLRAGAIYERKYLLGTSMARPVIAKVTFLRNFPGDDGTTLLLLLEERPISFSVLSV